MCVAMCILVLKVKEFKLSDFIAFPSRDKLD